MFDGILEILTSLGLPGVFVGVFFEAIGLPFPGSVLVAFAGFLSKQGEFSIITAWLVSLLGYLLGSLSAFMIGRNWGGPCVERWSRFIRLTPERIDKALEFLQKSAPAYIIVGRFIPTLGNITPYVAGISRISIQRFLLYDMVHAVLWLTAFLGAGALVQNIWRDIRQYLWLKWLAIGVSILILFYVFKHLLPIRSRK